MEEKRLFASNIPENSGCYLMKDEDNKIIYIGKAKNLKKRVLQYFSKNINQKTKVLVSKIKKIDYIITNTDKEAFILENNLIKKHKPFYNIKLVDDKTYPYIVITTKINSRLKVMHRLPKEYIKAYGPFPRSKSARDIARYLNMIYPFVKCRTIPNYKCIYYDIGACLAPCITKKEYDYSLYIKDIDDFLNNRSSKIISKLEEKRDKAKEVLDYESAKKYQDLIKSSTHLLQRQVMENPNDPDADYVGIYHNNDKIMIYILHKRDGAIRSNYHAKFSYLLKTNDAINSYLNLYYENQFGVKRVYLPKSLENHIEITKDDIKLYYPYKGTQKELLDLATKNAKSLFLKEENIAKLKLAKSKTLVRDLTNFLGFYPENIDAIDISQLFGTNHVGCIIRFNNLKVVPKMFRSYKLDNYQDDYYAIYETVKKRFKDNLMTNLIITDGGIGQVGSVKKALNELKLNYPVLGLTKNNNHELEKIYYNNKYHNVDKKSELFKFFLFVSEKVHKYAIDNFRRKHLKNYKLSLLENVKGIGLKRKRILLLNFKSYEEMLLAPDSKYKELGIPESVVKKLRKELENAPSL